MLRPHSLKRRLLLLTVVTAGASLLAAWFVLSALFRDQARQQFIDRLTADLDQVIARLEVGPLGQPTLDPNRLSDPRWTRPHSGLYWQVDEAGASGVPARLRSRSLWDEQLQAPRDLPAPGELHVHETRNAGDEPLLLIERTLRVDGAQAPWRVMVAAETRPLTQAARRFDEVLTWSLLALLALLAAAAMLQVALGLAPLDRLRRALADLRDGRTLRLEGRYPGEIQPLVDDLNGVLERHAEVLQSARAQAGNLAHALKTPLTVLSQGASHAGESEAALRDLPTLVSDQVIIARRHVDWHLARSRAAAAQGSPGLRTPLKPLVDGLIRVMQKVHAQRPLDIDAQIDANLAFAGEPESLQEMLGNLIDNACKAARSRVRIQAIQAGPHLHLTVDDDGPGIPQARMSEALRRGHRLDETTPGSGLGLAIVQELAQQCGGSLALSLSDTGGLQARLSLPAA